MRLRRGLLLSLLLGPALLLTHLTTAEAEQPGKVYRVGLLLFADRQAAPYAALLRERLRDLGYREGHEIMFEERFLAGRPDRLPEMAADLVRRPVDLIVTRYDGETRAAKRATDSIPIVMLEAVDPVGNGFVASLAQPGGNVTGLTFDAGFEVASKRIEILKEALPKLKSVGFLFNPEFPGMAGYVSVWKATTASLGLESQAFEVRESKDIRAALAAIKQARPGAVFIGGGFSVSVDDRQRIVNFTIESRLPAMVITSAWMRLGGLIGYLPSDHDRARRGAAFIDKILKGAKPADLPVEQPTQFELVINLKTAKALGLTIPRSLMLRADQVIE